MFRLLHILALFWMLAGVGAVVVPIWRAWRTEDLETRALLLSEAQRNEAAWLLPGLIATWFTGFALATAANLNIVVTWWLLAKEIIFRGRYRLGIRSGFRRGGICSGGGSGGGGEPDALVEAVFCELLE